MKRTLARRATALTFATALLAISFALALASSGTGCTAEDAASVAVSSPAPIACAVTSFTNVATEPPFDSPPITPVESAGASRTE